MLFIRKRVLTALALSLALALPAFAAPVPTEGPAAANYDKYLPNDVDGVITINVRQLLDSELIKKTGIDKAMGTEDAQKAAKTLGLDPLKDIERVVIAGGKNDDQTVVIIQGKFDPAKLSAAIEEAARDKKDNLKVHKTDNGKVYEVTKLEDIVKLPPQLGAGANVNLKGKSVFAVIADRGNVVVSPSKETVEEVLAKAAGKKTTKLSNKELATLLGKIDAKQTLAVALPAPATEEKFKSITGGLTVTKDVKVDFTVTAADADAAKEINDKIAEQLRQASDVINIVVIQQTELKPAVEIIKGIKHSAKDNTVSITSDIKGDTLEKLAKGLKELAEKAGGGIK
jgi:hypothetical protein